MSNVQKIYYGNELKDTIKSQTTNSSSFDWEKPCLYSFSVSSNGVPQYQVYYKKNGANNYVYHTITLTQLGWVQTGSINTSTSAPRNCYNSSQIVGSFESTNNKYDSYILTNNNFYHPKIDSILVIFFIITLVCIYFPYKIFSRAFGRWLKV